GKLITNSLEKAQEKIEGFNFDSRKHILEFDDVLNFQRNIIYSKRREVLTGDEESVRNYLNGLAEILEPEEFQKLEGKLTKDTALEPIVLEALRRIILQTIDLFWVDHLEMMEYLRSSVNLRAYGQRDPLVEYKKDGLRFFRDMEASIGRQVAEFIISLDFSTLTNFRPAPIEVEATALSDSDRVTTDDGLKIGRNDQCPCGSGKKWKKCGMLNTEEHQRLILEKK
ncbi:SEC-C domain-containing protein, partial [Candidatus Parcubacteria bacterium]|nr:SEC-C domain-containing protein [Candidatus Parcubacteria bacterium]